MSEENHESGQHYISENIRI